MDIDSINYFSAFASGGLLASLIALAAGLRERRHRLRRNLDRVSFISWGLVSALSSIVAITLLATAAKIYFASAA